MRNPISPYPGPKPTIPNLQIKTLQKRMKGKPKLRLSRRHRRLADRSLFRFSNECTHPPRSRTSGAAPSADVVRGDASGRR